MSPSGITRYLDYRAFLQHWFDRRKEANPDYSYAVFAREAGCSKSALPNVLSGVRTPRAETLDAFARAIELTPTERNFLGLLVDLDAAPDVSTRRHIIERLVAIEAFGQVRRAEKQPDQDVDRFFAAWYVPAIYELAGIDGFRGDPSWIATKLCPPIETDQAATALETLLELGYLQPDAQGRIRKCEIQFRTSEEAFQTGVHRYHREVVPKLLNTISTDRYREQHLLALTMSVSPELVPELKNRLNKVIEQLAAMADEDNAAKKRVYQVALQLLPVSQELAATERPSESLH